MSQTSIIDDIFIGGQRYSKKQTVREILGDNGISLSGHQRFYSTQFIPFVSERDVKGKIIKRLGEKMQRQRQISLWKLCMEGDFQKNNKDSKRDSSIDLRFKLNEISHFKKVDTKSHLEKLPEFKKQLKSLQNKDYERKRKVIKQQEEFWFTNYQRLSAEQDKNQQKISKQIQSIKKRAQSLKDLKHNQIIEKLSKKSLNKLQLSQINSSKTLLNTNRHRNPQLQQIQRQVKVHFNHPELDRLKQSRKLDFKFLQNLEKGDKKFKQKVQEYRMIKERIKKQMTKL